MTAHTSRRANQGSPSIITTRTGLSWNSKSWRSVIPCSLPESISAIDSGYRLRSPPELPVAEIHTLAATDQEVRAPALDYLLRRTGRVAREHEREPAHDERLTHRDPLLIGQPMTRPRARIRSTQPDALQLLAGFLRQRLKHVVAAGVQRADRLTARHHDRPILPARRGGRRELLVHPGRQLRYRLPEVHALRHLAGDQVVHLVRRANHAVADLGEIARDEDPLIPRIVVPEDRGVPTAHGRFDRTLDHQVHGFTPGRLQR